MKQQSEITKYTTKWHKLKLNKCCVFHEKEKKTDEIPLDARHQLRQCLLN